MFDRRLAARQAGLLLAVFLATLVLLAGGRALLAKPSSGGNGGLRTAGSSLAAVASGGAGRSHASGSGQPRSTKPGGSGEVPTITLLGAGDIADCSSTGAAQTSDILIGQQGSIFTAGDNAYENGSPKDFSACYEPTWGRLFDRTVIPAAGNHDWNTAGAAGYLAYFGAKAAPDGKTWYSLDLGGWHIVVLDSDCAAVGGCDAQSEQGRWLAKDLALSQARCTMAIWHHPRFSSGEHGNDRDVGPFWDLLHKAGAELIINGHDHDYERFAPQDPAGAVERPGGLREIVVGTGGADLRQFRATAPNSEFRQAGMWGVLRLTLHPFNYDWEFLPVSGNIADSGSMPCH